MGSDEHEVLIDRDILRGALEPHWFSYHHTVQVVEPPGPGGCSARYGWAGTESVCSHAATVTAGSICEKGHVFSYPLCAAHFEHFFGSFAAHTYCLKCPMLVQARLLEAVKLR